MKKLTPKTSLQELQLCSQQPQYKWHNLPGEDGQLAEYKSDSDHDHDETEIDGTGPDLDELTLV